MTRLPGMPSVPGGGRRQQRAAQIKAEMEAKQRLEQGDAGTQEQPAEGSATGEPADQGATTQRAVPPEDAEEQGTGPVGQGDHVVKEGECISSIAKDTGHFWEKIWNDPANAELKEVRQDPNVLLPDDRVTIPDLQKKQEPGETEMRHRFVRRGEPCVLRLRILADGEPRANEPYVLTVDGREHAGTTSPDGRLEAPLPGNARAGHLILGSDEDETEYKLMLGHTAPIDDVTGIQQRLTNLGYPCGATDGIRGPRTRSALRAFQERYGLQATGEPESGTLERLKAEHGS